MPLLLGSTLRLSPGLFERFQVRNEIVSLLLVWNAGERHGVAR